MKISKSVASLAVAAATICMLHAQAAQPPAVPAGKLQSEMHQLWNDHVALTRKYLLEAVANQPSANATLKRLMQNQVDIGNAFKPYYGNPAGNQLTALLKEHIAFAGKIIESGKKAPLPSVPAINEWYANADQIAALLHQLNPQSWGLEEMKKMMHHHLKITTSEVLSCLHGGTGPKPIGESIDKPWKWLINSAPEFYGNLARRAARDTSDDCRQPHQTRTI
jgi:hypothetical protein